MKKLLIILFLLITTNVFAASTYTTNYTLTKPGVGDTGWGAAVNTNFDTIDTQMKANADNVGNALSDSTWTLHNSYPSACTAGQYVSAIGDTLTCGTPAGMTYTAGDNLTLTGTDFDVDDSFILNTGDVGTGVYDFGGATSIEIVNGTSPTVDAAGEIAVDTTDDQLIYYGGAKRVITYKQQKCFALETPSADDDNVSIFFPTDAITITNMYCMTKGGTSVEVILSDGTNALDTMTCDADGATDDGNIANATFTANEEVQFDIGTLTGEVDWVTFCFTYTTTSE